MAFKLTIIGAGSLTFARTLFTDIMHVPELRGIEVAFTDINQDNLDRVTRLCQRDLDAHGPLLPVNEGYRGAVRVAERTGDELSEAKKGSRH